MELHNGMQVPVASKLHSGLFYGRLQGHPSDSGVDCISYSGGQNFLGKSVPRSYRLLGI